MRFIQPDTQVRLHRTLHHQFRDSTLQPERTSVQPPFPQQDVLLQFRVIGTMPLLTRMEMFGRFLTPTTT